MSSKTGRHYGIHAFEFRVASRRQFRRYHAINLARSVTDMTEVRSYLLAFEAYSLRSQSGISLFMGTVNSGEQLVHFMSRRLRGVLLPQI